jgi:hypothetical protein
MHHNRTISVFAVAAAVTVAAAACASSGTTGSGQAGKAANSGAAGDSGAASAQAMTLLAKMPAPQAVEASTKAVAAKNSAKVHMTVTSPALSETADGTMSFGSSLAMDLTMQMSSSDAQTGAALSQMGKMEMRMTGLVAYVNLGDSQQMVDALQGKQWMKIDFNHLDGVPGLSNFAFVKDLGKNNDPSTQLKAMLASPDLKKVGQETRNGVQTLHFSGTVAANDMLKASAAGGLTQQDLDSLSATAKQAGISKTDYDVWVDGNGLPVEVKFSEETKTGTVAGDVGYSDWGTPVSVTAPPADQVVDIVQALKSEQQG